MYAPDTGSTSPTTPAYPATLGAMPIITVSPASSCLELAVGTTALDRLPLPTMALKSGIRRLEDFTFGDFKLEGYEAQPHIKAPVAV